MGFLLALGSEFEFDPEPLIHVVMLDRSLEDEWKHEETYRRLDNRPTNEALDSLRLSNQIFWNLQRIYGYKTFYLYKITFSRTSFLNAS